MRQWEPEVWGGLDLFGSSPDITADADAPDAEESDADADSNALSNAKEVVFDTRPLGLRLCPAKQGDLGAIIEHCSPQAALAGVQPGSILLTVNSQNVETVPTEEIQSCLESAQIPVTLALKPTLHLPQAKRMKSRPKDPVTICTARCRGSYRAVHAALEHIGWKAVASDNREASVVWLEHADSAEGLAPVQTVSRIDAFLQLCRKAPLAKCLSPWMEELPDAFSFFPETWVLPRDATELEAAMTRAKATYIAKPSAGCQGQGIILARRWSDLLDIMKRSKPVGEASAISEYVVQRYISRPFLLDGLKFDMRIYAVVTSVVPLRAYLFKEGLARFCTVPYQPPKDANLQDVCMHLTNFAVNKRSKEFKTTEGLEQHDEGSKRSVSSVFWQLERSHGTTADEMWHRIAELTANTLMAIRPGLVEYYAQAQQLHRPQNRPRLHPAAPKGFQIIGLDVLLDSQLQPKLLELNANASLSVMQPDVAAVEPEPACPLDASHDASPPAGAAEDLPASPSTPAGSGLCAARSLSAERTDPEDQGGEHCLQQTAATAVNAVASDRAAVMARLEDKLQDLSLGDLLQVEAHTNALLTNDAVVNVSAEGAPTLTEPAASHVMDSSTDASTSPAPAALQSAVSSREPQSSSIYTPRPTNSPTCSTARSSADCVVHASTGRVGAMDRRRSISMRSRRRLGMTRRPSKEDRQEKPKEKKKMVTSPLDLEIKKELIAQTLLLARPAPQSKVLKLRNQWYGEAAPDPQELEPLPLDDNGDLVTSSGRAAASDYPAVRPDAPGRCPAMEPLDFGELVAPDVVNYAKAHLALYRLWARSCGPGQSTLGQVPMEKLMDRRGFVGPGRPFADKIHVQLWLTRKWRDYAAGSFGVDFQQFVQVAGCLGNMLANGGAAPATDAAEQTESNILLRGVVDFINHDGQ
mmetsp:Transcript_120507/g.239864  ORF Transcript_120507/g.239864 Transcript_120507/m.239864 type:complete len:924 (+) Transcript_120507:122-2893(+)